MSFIKTCIVAMTVLNILHAQSQFGFHNASDNPFRQGFTARELINLGNHLAIRHPFVLQGLALS